MISSLPTLFGRNRSVRRIAIFVEGQTEQLFVEKLLTLFARNNDLTIESQKWFGGRRFPRIILSIRTSPPKREERYFALIFDCGTDGRVTSDVLDQYQSLVAKGYEAIVALRDVRPQFQAADVPKLKSAFSQSVPKHPITPLLVLAVMEIEAWFIADYSHFARIEASLTPQHVGQSLNIDFESHAIEGIAAPADLLEAVYALGGATYDKSAKDVDRTIEALDFDFLLSHLPTRAPNFEPLKHVLTEFFSGRLANWGRWAWQRLCK